jgi:hypothetical protein
VLTGFVNRNLHTITHVHVNVRQVLEFSEWSKVAQLIVATCKGKHEIVLLI